MLSYKALLVHVTHCLKNITLHSSAVHRAVRFAALRFLFEHLYMGGEGKSRLGYHSRSYDHLFIRAVGCQILWQLSCSIEC